MPSLEQIIRPFAAPSPHATRRIIASSKKIEVGRAILTFGAAGTLPGAQQLDAPEPEGANFTVITCDDAYSETTRKTEKVRITGNDPSNFVDVNRVQEIAFKKKEKYDPDPNKPNAPLAQGNMAHEKTTSAYNSSVFESATFRTMSNDQQSCKSKFYLNNQNV